ncbi:MAG TPA: choice-of-anchor D domain-containing protein [Terriglobia bacterium]|nr:choice-of-anchor D domain-containing protein [Terriglobia bacterium]
MKAACIRTLCGSTLLAAALASPTNAGPQASAPHALDAGQSGLVTLRGNTRPEATAPNDRGRVSDDLTINHMMLQLRRTPEQEQALQQFIREIHDPKSPLFHHWITAAEFGRRYGVSPDRLATVTDWLQSQGFKLNLVYPSQMVIDFTGSAGQISQAFHTEIHQLLVKGQAHIANISDPQIPAALASTVAGVVSLNDFRPHPMFRQRAEFTIGGDNYLVVPADLATIYNFKPAFAAGFSGQGQTIVLIEDTDLYTTTDWDTFRSVLGLASAYPLGSLTQVNPPSSPTNNCIDPGVNDHDAEAAIDVEWASAGAPSATIELASCSDTETTFGGFIALQNLLNASDTPPAIVSISYGESESLNGAAGNALINSLYQQAITEGVSVFVSSGDEGAVISDAGKAPATHGISVSALTSTPYNVSVGGTDFADTYEGATTTYWNSNAANYGSALSYVPEIPWNDSCASVLIADFLNNDTLPTYGSTGLCNSTSYLDQDFLLTTVSGSGGPSGCATGAPDTDGVVSGTCAGYAKPLWQSGLIGNPSDGVRDIPDVSLFTANGVWGHYYVVCFSDPNNGGPSCSGTPDTWAGFGGTSISSPIMAAIQSLVNQASGSRWGNPNPTYYALAATEYGAGGSTSCNSALGNQVASNCIFYDVTQIPLLYLGSGTGGDIDVPCLGMNCYLPSGTYGVLSTGPQTLTSVSVTNLGSGYTSAPSCTLSGGGGSGATCSASTTGVVSSLTLTNGGSGYTTNPTCTLTGGGGTGASCTASISDTTAVNAVFLTSFGSGYTSAPTCTISSGGGTGATCTATAAAGIAVTLTGAGSGYTTLPQCVLSGGGGTGATCASQAINTSGDYQPAFGAATGWDFATGIGTVNASNLVANFVSGLATFSPPSLAFPPQSLITSGAAQSVTVTDTGTTNLTISTVTIGGSNAGDFATSADTCTGATLTPNATCTVSVTFTPTATGSRSAALNFTDNASNSPQTVALSGTGTAPVVSLSASGLSFGSQLTNTTGTAQSETVTDTGTANLIISTVTLGGTNAGDFAKSADTCTGATVAPNGTCTVSVTFAPTATGSRSAALNFTDNASNSPQTVALSGTGTAPLVSFSASGLSFGTQLASPTNAAQSETVTNTGTANLIISTVTLGGTNTGDFAKSADTCTGATILPNGACTVSVTFAPSATGSRSAALTFSDNASNSPQTVTLSGAVTAPLVSLSAAGLSFGSQPLSTTSSAQSETVTNTGTANLTISTVTMGGANGSDFAKSADTCTGATIAPNGTCTVTVTFAPSATGSRSAALSFTDNAFKSPQTVTLSGAGTVPVVSLSAAVLSFGSQPLSATSTAQSETVTNAGTANLTISTVTLGGTNASDFGRSADTCTGATVAPNGTCTVSVTFAPTATGSRSAALNFTDNASNSPQTVTLSGAGTTPLVSLSALDLSFGGQPLSATSTAQSETVTNTGTANLAISTVTMGGANGSDFAKSADTCTGATIAPNGICTVTVTFAPTAIGNRSASLSFTDNASDSPETVILTGTGTGPVVSLSTSSLTFSARMSGTSSAAQTVTLTNTGNASLTVSSITASGDFSQTNTCGASVSAGANCAISVTFKPASGGTRTGALSISDNAVDSPQSVTLSGTGQDFTFAALSRSSTSAGVVPGQPATYTLSVGGEGGLSGTVTFTCTGAPSEATCTVSPNPLTAGSSATNVTVTVTTTAASISAPRSRPLPLVPPLPPGLTSLLMLALILAAMAWVIENRTQPGVSPWQSTMALLAAGLSLTLAVAGCGGGGGGRTPNPGTPVGTYTLTVTGSTGSGSATLSHSVTLTLNVN